MILAGGCGLGRKADEGNERSGETQADDASWLSPLGRDWRSRAAIINDRPNDELPELGGMLHANMPAPGTAAGMPRTKRGSSASTRSNSITRNQAGFPYRRKCLRTGESISVGVPNVLITLRRDEKPSRRSVISIIKEDLQFTMRWRRSSTLVEGGSQ